MSHLKMKINLLTD